MRKAIIPIINAGFSILDVNIIGSQMGSPYITTVAEVTRVPTKAKLTIPKGSPTN
ncbi:hypothetical protein MASR2M70_11720 [Bacillota bacterium]